MPLTIDLDADGEGGLLLAGTATELTGLCEAIMAAVEGREPDDVIAQLFTDEGIERLRCVVVDHRGKEGS